MLNNMLMKAHIWVMSRRAELADEEAQGTVEYALVLGVIVVALFVAFTTTSLREELGNAIEALAGIFEAGAAEAP